MNVVTRGKGLCIAAFRCFLWGVITVSSAHGVSSLTAERQSARHESAALTEAWEYYDRGEIIEARAIFSAVASNEKADEEDLVQALFGLGWCGRYGRPRPDRSLAQQSFNLIVEQYPDNPATPWALLELGALEVRKERGGGESARPHFKRVLSEYPDSAARHEAVLRLASTYFYELDLPLADRGAELLETHLREEPGNPLAVVMHFRLAQWYNEIHQETGRTLPHARHTALEKMSDPFRWSIMYWQVAEIYRLRLGQPEKAIPFYVKIIVECPQSVHIWSAKQRIETLTGQPWAEVVAEHAEEQLFL